ncbi:MULTISPECIES: rhodanese-like domain-containing protein [Rheinheimera]|uniref:rhodanese-like domain-containing protein n=1 Tax=Rheinheimera TaxID=67575 RepID=UPI00104BD0F5|nr:rhodanese-like domain-containing protein [Rheinheimera sp. D18]QBL09507.1 rhodanese-like domain-containing protein [Rheinheimera sp. D18]
MKTLIALLLLVITACTATPPQTVWIDVRSADEYAAGHLVNTVNIPHTEIASGVAKLNLSKDTPIAVYCKSGRRADVALETLQQLGYSNVVNKGGYEDLKQKLNSEHERK